MLRPLLTFTLVTLVCLPALAQESEKIPESFAQQMKRMAGSWVFTGKDGERRLSGAEKIRVVNDGTALLQEGYFDLASGKKEHYVILTGWDAERQLLDVRGFTSEGLAFRGEWKTLKKNALMGKANGKPASFVVRDKTMIYEEDGGSWTTKFERLSEEK